MRPETERAECGEVYVQWAGPLSGGRQAGNDLRESLRVIVNDSDPEEKTTGKLSSSIALPILVVVDAHELHHASLSTQSTCMQRIKGQTEFAIVERKGQLTSTPTR